MKMQSVPESVRQVILLYIDSVEGFSAFEVDENTFIIK